jgi:cytoskeletal protein CcmA (bactofilin family)
MFNKRNEPLESSGPADSHREPSGLRVDPVASPAPPRKSEPSIVGPSILIQGDMTGDEDLIVQGRIEGSISLKKNLVTVGKDGRVNATVNAQIIRVEGTVEGELRGREQVIVTRTGSVSGNIVAPRVTLEDGCRFKGSIDMEGSDAGSAGKVTDIMLGASVADESGKAN